MLGLTACLHAFGGLIEYAAKLPTNAETKSDRIRMPATSSLVNWLTHLRNAGNK